MKSYKDTKIAIMGFGFLMGYIYDCYANFLGKENLKTNIIAITADQNTIEEKRRKYPFEISLKDNLGALRKIEPDIILFAPPPSVAPQIIDNELKQYFKECKEKPDIYAFPPTPPGKYYLDVLGDDIFVCNILPNMVKEIGGVSLKGREGYSTVTYPEGLVEDPERVKRLDDFLRPLGTTVAVQPDKIMDVLAAYVMIDLWPHRIIKSAEYLEMDRHMDFLEKSEVAKTIIKEISSGILEYLEDKGFDPVEAEQIVFKRNRLVFHLIADTEKEILLKDMASHATTGGVFEKGVRLHEIFLDHSIEDLLDGKDTDIRLLTKSMLELISEHGRRLSESDISRELHPGIHAMLFGLYVRELKKRSNADYSDLVKETVIKYGNQRGRRMRIRSDRAGFTGNMNDYMAFGEWKAEKGSMDIREVRRDTPAVTRVHKCPWCTEWKKYGFMEEGLHYCRYVDKALVEGFNSSLELGLKTIKPEGYDYCEFEWNEASLDEIQEVDEKNRIMPWDFHIAHLFNCIIELLPEDKEIHKKLAEDIKGIYGVDLFRIREKYKGFDFNSP